jgi:hypothetical protein
MFTLSPAVSWVNNPALASVQTDASGPVINVVLILLVVVMLVWALKNLRPALVLATQILQLALRAALGVALIVGALVLLLMALMIH